MKDRTEYATPRRKPYQDRFKPQNLTEMPPRRQEPHGPFYTREKTKMVIVADKRCRDVLNSIRNAQNITDIRRIMQSIRKDCEAGLFTDQEEDVLINAAFHMVDML